MKIPEGQKLGGICKRGHDHNGTGKSIRYERNGACVACQQELYGGGKSGKAKREGAPAPAAAKERRPPPPRRSAEVIAPVVTATPSLAGLVAELCASMPLADFAARVGLSCVQLVELVMPSRVEVRIEPPISSVPTPAWADAMPTVPTPAHVGKAATAKPTSKPAPGRTTGGRRSTPARAALEADVAAAQDARGFARKLAEREDLELAEERAKIEAELRAAREAAGR